MPINRRLPKRGFTNIFRKQFAAVNIGDVQRAIDAGRLDAAAPIDAAALRTAGLGTRGRDGIRLLAKGEISTKVDLHVTGASKAAVAAVEKAGGAVTVAQAAAAPAADDA